MSIYLPEDDPYPKGVLCCPLFQFHKGLNAREMPTLLCWRFCPDCLGGWSGKVRAGDQECICLPDTTLST